MSPLRHLQRQRVLTQTGNKRSVKEMGNKSSRLVSATSKPGKNLPREERRVGGGSQSSASGDKVAFVPAL